MSAWPSADTDAGASPGTGAGASTVAAAAVARRAQGEDLDVLPGALLREQLVDDEGLVRSGFKVLLDREEDITVVGEATNGAEAVEQEAGRVLGAGALAVARLELAGLQPVEVRLGGLDGAEPAVPTGHTPSARQ